MERLSYGRIYVASGSKFCKHGGDGRAGPSCPACGAEKVPTQCSAKPTVGSICEVFGLSSQLSRCFWRFCFCPTCSALAVLRCSAHTARQRPQRGEVNFAMIGAAGQTGSPPQLHHLQSSFPLPRRAFRWPHFNCPNRQPRSRRTTVLTCAVGPRVVAAAGAAEAAADVPALALTLQPQQPVVKVCGVTSPEDAAAAAAAGVQ